MPNLNVGFLVVGAVILTSPAAMASWDATFPNDDSCELLNALEKNLAVDYPSATERRNLTATQVYDYIYKYCHTVRLDVRGVTQEYCMNMLYESNGLSASQMDTKLKDFGLQLATGEALQNYESPFYITFCGCDGYGSDYEPAEGGRYRLLKCQKVCSAGTYLDSDDTCLDCPDDGRSARGSTAITQCYKSRGSDDTGNYSYETLCYYTK